MKKFLYVSSILLIIISQVACSKNLSTTEELLEYVQEKGNEDLTWSDFNHLKHNNIGDNYIEEIYYLKDGNRLRLLGTSYKKAPEKIMIEDYNLVVIDEIK